jgi:hypothetical protein
MLSQAAVLRVSVAGECSPASMTSVRICLKALSARRIVASNAIKMIA